jgi:uncharacterized membrane protein YphA (DoxX/SURF4 family)
MLVTEPVTPRWMIWAGRLLAVPPVLMLIVSGVMKVAGVAEVVRDFTGRFGFPAGTLTPIGLLELGCTVVFLVPRAAVLGAVLLTGFLGGAVVAHVRTGEYLVSLAPALLGVFVWGSVYLREPRLRALLPLRGPD